MTSKTTKSGRYLKYVKSWELDPNLKDWIAPMPGDDRSAFCKVCRRPFVPHKKDLLLHAKTLKHTINFKAYKESKLSSTPLKDVELDGEEIYELDTSKVKREPRVSQERAPKNDVTIAIYPESSEILQSNVNRTSLDDDVNDTASIVIGEEPPIPTSNPYYQWKRVTEFQGWLEVEGDRLYCKLCIKDMKPNKTDMIKHSLGKVHQKKCLKLGIPISTISDQNTSSFSNGDSSVFQPDEKNIDLRSDTITQPNSGMKSAMLQAEMGDDTYGDDPSVKALEEKVTNILEKEASILLPSGTMANLVAVMTHCWSRDSEVIVGDESFLQRWSQGGLARLGGIFTKTIPNEQDGTFSLEHLKSMLRDNESWVIQTLVCVENTHSRLGGRVLPLQWIKDLGEYCREKDILLHMDGARLLNASVSCGTSPAELVRYCHSSTFCLNKGLGSPIGSVLVGSKDFIKRAKRIRTLLGGTMHQAGMFSAGSLYALQHITPKLHWDHANARAIAESIRDIYSTAVRVSPSLVQTNIVHLHTDNIRVNAKALCERLSKINGNEYEEMGELIKIQTIPLTDTIVRLVTHYDLSKSDVQSVIQKFKLVIEEYDNMLDLDAHKIC